MTRIFHIPRAIRRFFRAEEGAQLVEFAIVLPITMLIFAVIVEGSRLMWAYQATGAGVREATRYLSRVISPDICDFGGTTTAWNADAEAMVRNSYAGSDNSISSVFPTGISIKSVTVQRICPANNYRAPKVAAIRVSASLEVTFPFESMFTFAVPGSSLDTITTTVSDQSRVYGI